MRRRRCSCSVPMDHQLPAGFKYEVDVNNSPEEAVELFDINDDGSLFLNDDEDQALDHEDYEDSTGTCFR